MDSNQLNKSCFSYNGYHDFSRLLLTLARMWSNVGITKRHIAIMGGILMELMVLSGLAVGFPFVASSGPGSLSINAVSAYEAQTVESIHSLKDGQWTDPTVWSTGRVPTSGDEVLLSHAITVPSGALAEVQRLLYDANGDLLFEDSTARLQLGFVVSSTPLRLKTVQGGSINTTYTYDSQNRLATITRATGNRLNVYNYDDAQEKVQLKQYPNPANQTTGTVVRFPYNANGLSSYVARTYGIINSAIYEGTLFSTESYTINPDGHLAIVLRGPGEPGSSPTSTTIYSYTYTGENITKGSSVVARAWPYTFVYEYDTQTNPFFGSTDPGLDDSQRFSRNNVVKLTKRYPESADQIIVYQYDYNQHGLPIKRTAKQGNTITEVLTYTYE